MALNFFLVASSHSSEKMASVQAQSNSPSSSPTLKRRKFDDLPPTDTKPTKGKADTDMIGKFGVGLRSFDLDFDPKPTPTSEQDGFGGHVTRAEWAVGRKREEM